MANSSIQEATNWPKIMKPAMALEYIGAGVVGRNRFFAWLRSGKVPSVRDGSRIYIARTALDQLLEQIARGEWPDA